MSHDGNLIAGGSVLDGARFESGPINADVGRSDPVGTPEIVERACEAAADAFAVYSATSRHNRAGFLRRIANGIEARGADITRVGSAETGLPEARLEGERGRTTGQLRMFAILVEAGDHLDIRRDAADPDRRPAPKPDLRLMQVPIGPVAVFGASNFPLAFSTAGGDTASALGAGCPVVVKGHPGHPGIAAIVAEAIGAAIEATGMPAGTFSLVNDGGPGNDGADSRAVGAALVAHPSIKAVGFTGSLRGGRALYDIATRRDEPIPFFGELGSINPVFVLPSAAKNRISEIATGWIDSLTIGVGQFCTNPGIIVVPRAHAETFIEMAAQALGEVGDQPMLTKGIAAAYRSGVRRLSELTSVDCHLAGARDARLVRPALFSVSAGHFLENPEMAHEVFGPCGIVVVTDDLDDGTRLAEGLVGQLTATLQLDAEDHAEAKELIAVLRDKVGRLICNGYPTGVEVSAAMMHGGPWPASTNASATSVGTLAIRRFLRPVAYQDFPAELLPEELQ